MVKTRPASEVFASLRREIAAIEAIHYDAVREQIAARVPLENAVRHGSGSSVQDLLVELFEKNAEIAELRLKLEASNRALSDAAEERKRRQTELEAVRADRDVLRVALSLEKEKLNTEIRSHELDLGALSGAIADRDRAIASMSEEIQSCRKELEKRDAAAFENYKVIRDLRMELHRTREMNARLTDQLTIAQRVVPCRAVPLKL